MRVSDLKPPPPPPSDDNDDDDDDDDEYLIPLPHDIEHLDQYPHGSHSQLLLQRLVTQS